MNPQLNYKIMGQGYPVIILHGLFGMLDNWQFIAKKLADTGFMAILVDQRDHGRSPHTEDFNYHLLAQDIYRLINDLHLNRPILIGHSMGGKTCLQFVSDYESIISKLVVVDIGIKRYEGDHQHVFNALFDVNLKEVTSRGEVEKILSKHLNDTGTIQFLMKNLSRDKEGGFEWKMNLPLLFKKYQNILSNVQFSHRVMTTTLFIKGDKSDYILHEDWPEILDVLPNSQLRTISEAGHWVHADQPLELFDIIIDFIKE